MPGTWRTRSPPHRILLTRLRSFAPRAAGARQARPGTCLLAVARGMRQTYRPARSQPPLAGARGLSPPPEVRGPGAGPTADRRRSELFTTGSYRRSDMPRECLNPSTKRERPIEKSPLRAAVWDRRIDKNRKSSLQRLHEVCQLQLEACAVHFLASVASNVKGCRIGRAGHRTGNVRSIVSRKRRAWPLAALAWAWADGCKPVRPAAQRATPLSTPPP